MTITPTPTAEQHYDEFVRLRKAGFSYRAIGAKFGLSHERVRQVLVRDGEPADWARTTARTKRKAKIAEITKWLDENGPVARDQVLEQFGLSKSQLTQMIAEGLPSHQMLVASRPQEQQFSDEQVNDAVVRAWDDIQRLNPRATGLSHVLYERVRQIHDPSAALLIARYGWEVACANAGVPSGLSLRPKDTYQTRWADADILAKVGEYVTECMAEGNRPSYLGYDRWQQYDADAPSGTLVRNRMRTAGLTTWPDIVMAASTVAAGA